MDILLSGGTGFIGGFLTKALLERGDSVTIISRNPKREKASERVCFISWDDNLTKAVSASDAVINLAGSNLFDKRWNDKVRKEIVVSRVFATSSLVKAIQDAGKKPKVFLSGSAVGYYGNRGSERLTEESAPSDDFLSKVCQRWEEEALKLNESAVRTVITRVGIVQHPSDGALQKMLLPFKLFGGGPLGSGEQYYPWIHVEDTVGLILFALDNPEISGPLNVTAPEPVTMNTFAHTLGEVMGRPSWMPVPEFLLKIAVGDSATSIVASHRVIPKKALSNRYKFQYSDLKDALTHLLG